MAAGYDKLVDFLLSEIALCGVQGASSADFHRFIDKYYEQQQTHEPVQSVNECSAAPPSSSLSRCFYERVWQWISNHPEVRTTHRIRVRDYSLSEFQVAEAREAGKPVSIPTADRVQLLTAPPLHGLQPSNALSNLATSLKRCLTQEEDGMDNRVAITSEITASKLLRQTSRQVATTTHLVVPIFSNVDPNITSPRLHVSQNRTWQALTGHGMDLKRVPAMEFMLLSLIAAHGPKGIPQPALTELSGQDKRSVPHRTDELARKGYIVKSPVQAGKARTSLCVHKRFASQGQSLSSVTVEDVFQDGTVVMAGFLHLVYHKLKDAGVVPTRDLRTKLDVPMRTWNKRAANGALVRLDQSGMIKRFRARRKHSDGSWHTCIKVLREPRDEDVQNLGFRKSAGSKEDATELLDEDADGDTLVTDMNVDMPDTPVGDMRIVKRASHETSEVEQFPPQWTPERFLPNAIFDAIALGGKNGCDSTTILHRVIGPFWKRPIESHLTRLTDNWKKTQPLSVRHLAIIRDYHNTDEKKTKHYVYRTYENFAKAVEAGEVDWEGASKAITESKPVLKQSNKKGSDKTVINAWGFHVVDKKDLVFAGGSATLSEARSAIVHRRKNGPRWDIALHLEIGYQKLQTPVSKKKASKSLGKSLSRKKVNDRQEKEKKEEEVKDKNESIQVQRISNTPKPIKKISLLSVTPEQRTSLGLKPYGRLPKNAEKQIVAHRRKSGDLTSLPGRIEEEAPLVPLQRPLLTKEERIAQGLPPRGRLGFEKENELRAERGLDLLAKKTKKQKKKSTNSKDELPLLTKEQRLAYGWTGYGRLPQDLIDGLRQERKDGILLKDSKVVPQFMDVLKAKAAKSNRLVPHDATESPAASLRDDLAPLSDQQGPSVQQSEEVELVTSPTAPTNTSAKRKTRSMGPSSKLQKRPRRGSDALQEQHANTTSLSSPDDTFPQEAMLEKIAASPSTMLVSTERNTSTLPAELSSFLALANTRDAPTTSFEIQQPSTLPKKTRSKAELLPTLMQPDVSSLSPEAQTLYSQYTNRSAPGLYANPFAKHKQVRGRPRNAFIVTFRFPQLQDPGWLQRASESLLEVQQKNLVENLTNSVQPVNLAVEEHLDVGLTQTADEVPITEDVLPTLQQDISQHMNPLERNWGPPLPLLTGSEVPLRTPPVEPELPLQTEQQVVPQHQEPYSSALEPQESVSQSQDISRAVSSEASNLTSLQTPTDSEHLSVPGSATHCPVSASGEQSGVQEHLRVTHAVVIVESAQQTPIEETVESPLHERRYSAISEVALPPPPKPRWRGKKEIVTEGSAVIFRRKIIKDIIDLCGGVFPDGGEIGRPFHTIWAQRHGGVKTLKEPIASTVNATMRDMCNYPQKYGLKRMSFLTKHKNSPLNYTRSMVTHANMTQNSPQVLQLASEMANFSGEKSHQYFPEQIRHLCGDKPVWPARPVAPKDDSFLLDPMNPELEASIQEARKRRRREIAQQRRDEAKAGQGNVQGDPHGQRPRLASLNHNKRRYRPLLPKSTSSLLSEKNEQHESRESIYPGNEEHITRERSSPESDSSETIPHIWKAPVVAPPVGRGSVDQRLEDGQATEVTADMPAVQQNSQKRVRIALPSDGAPKKKPRLNIVDTGPERDDVYAQEPRDESQDSSLSEAETEEDEESQHKASEKRKIPIKERRQSGFGPFPTLLERLTGLTGDQGTPIPQIPRPKFQPYRRDVRRIRDKSLKKGRKNTDDQNPIDKFKKLCCTLAVASSMNEENDIIEWRIVEQVYSRDKFFSIEKAEKLWIWMQSNMASQLAELTQSFQSAYLEAYEEGKMPEIDDFETYDWESLVRWAVPICKFPRPPFPFSLEALSSFEVAKSSYEALDRVKWYKEKMSKRIRIRIQYRSTFGVPLHGSRKPSWSAKDEVLKARSWVRANIATPQAVYDAYQAHEKFKVLDETTLANVVEDFVEKKALRMRKFKRLLPGRNYNFTATFAKKYSRPFDLSSFMDAVKLKKDMDAAFAVNDPQKRFYSISQFEDDGGIMAIDDLISQGKVRLVPQPPPIKNYPNAPLPRLSVWGFAVGIYLPRQLDSKRLFWDVHVVPTAEYQFGSPLQPLSSPPTPNETGDLVNWHVLPDPPMPGRDNDTALLPIWSSIDGQRITWPWWYRIVSLILQPLIFQPGATASQLLAHCPEHTTALFEVELVLDWLVSVGAATKTITDGYIVALGFWAVFGDKLLDIEDDWFGESVKRKTKKTIVQKWREAFDNRASIAAKRSKENTKSPPANEQNRDNEPTPAAMDSSSTQQILENPEGQNGIVQQLIDASKAREETTSASQASELVHTPGTDIEMVDRDEDADAPYEDDDEYPSPAPEWFIRD